VNLLGILEGRSGGFQRLGGEEGEYVGWGILATEGGVWNRPSPLLRKKMNLFTFLVYSY